MNRTQLISARPYAVKILAGGADVTHTSPVVRVKYDADGSGTRILRDGTTVAGHWRFSNPEQTQIEVEGPEGKSRWVVLELNEQRYRKANIDTGVEFIHLPIG